MIPYSISVIIVEDEENIRNRICKKIEMLDNTFRVIGIAENGCDALEEIQRHRPQVVFTDISMPVMGGLELIRKIRHIAPGTIIVIISGYTNFEYMQEAIRYGVFNYLQKPIENDKLMETLFDIRQNLLIQNGGNMKHILHSDNFQLLSQESTLFFVGVICVGNVIHFQEDSVVMEEYLGELKKIKWDCVMNAACRGAEWVLVDENSCNQQIFQIKSQGMDYTDIKEIIMTIHGNIRAYTKLHVSICYAREAVSRERMQEAVLCARNVIQNRVEIGKDNIMVMEEEPGNRSNVTEIVKMKLNQFMKNSFMSKDFDVFLDGIKTIFKYMKDSHTTQSDIAKTCNYILKLLEYSDYNLDGCDFEEIGAEVQSKISLAQDEESLFKELLVSLDSLKGFLPSYQEQIDPGKLMEYVEANYLKMESLDEIADFFGYSYAYLSRIFKKIAGENLGRYISRKKIEFAKNLMTSKPDMKLNEIAELCGYNDSRYFSRVFKKETGLTASEFREEQRK